MNQSTEFVTTRSVTTNKIRAAVNLLNLRLVEADCIGQSLDDAGGENAPAWVHVFRSQVEAIRDASEVLEVLLSGYGGNHPHGDTQGGASGSPSREFDLAGYVKPCAP